MKKWASLSVAAVLVVIGCGGSGGHSSSTPVGTNGGTVGPDVTVGIAGSTTGRAEFLYLTGQARDPGDLSAVVTRLTLSDQYGTVTNPEAPATVLPLKLYTSEIDPLDVPFTGQDSRLFTSFDLTFNSFIEQGATSSSSTTLTPPPDLILPARIRLFPGRNTSIPIFVDDSMFSDNGAGGVNFDTGSFEFRNLDANGNLDSFLSDYIGFSLPAAFANSARPQMSDGSFANEIFTSGDNFAIGNTATNEMDILTTTSTTPIVGKFQPQSAVAGRPTPGTYFMDQGNPTDLNQLAKIISLQGTWRDYQSVMTGFSSFEMITFPTIQDNNIQALMLIQRNSSGGIANLYYGFLDYNLGQFQSFPIADLVNATVTGEVDGTVSSYKTATGAATTVPDAVRYGTYQFKPSAGQTVPSGFSSTGIFVVYRG